MSPKTKSPKSMKPVDIYVRVSRVGGRDVEAKGGTAAEQERRCRAQLAADDLKAGKVFMDLDESGGKTSRPEFDKAMARIESGESGGLIVMNLRRFGRTTSGVIERVLWIEEQGARFLSCDEKIDTSTAMGRFGLTLFAALGTLELEERTESWARAQENAVERGIHIASRVPTGYVRADDRRLEPDPVAAPGVSEAFRRRAEGASWRELADLLNSRGIETPYGSHNWTASSVSKLIANRVYTGEARSGKHKNADAHPPLVTEAEWLAAQGARSVSSSNGNGHGEGSLLASILRCAGCRHVMKADKMTLRDGTRERIYRCRGEHASGVCKARPSVMGRVVEPYVVQQFFAALGRGGILARATVNSDELDALKREEDEAHRAYVAIVSRQGALDIDDETFRLAVEPHERRLNEARAAREAAQAASATPDLPSEAELVDTWDDLSIIERNRLLSSAMDAIMLRKSKTQPTPIEDRTHILWRGEAPSDFPSRGRRVALAPYAWPED